MTEDRALGWRRTFRNLSIHFAAAAWLFGACLVAPVSAQELSELPATGTEAHRVPVLVELSGAPAARVYGSTYDANSALGRVSATAAAVSAASAQVNRNLSEQAAVRSAIVSRGIAAAQIYAVSKAVNGIAYYVMESDIATLRSLPGVKAVHVIEQEYPTLSTSVPFIGAPNAWAGTTPMGVTGQGVRVGVIDTGVDYQHATFGGTGLLADYQANNRTVITDTIGGQPIFPTARVVGGIDLVGDAYTGSNAPAPDPDPMDCNGHGTHVASTVGGGGVKSDGTPFTGPYDTSTPFSSLKLGPGVAPQAKLYAIRVFGCGGSTAVTVQGIDWALDPNGDNDLSDHLDVINMSLGSNYGSLSNTSSMAADNAARMGVIVVASAGNAGDTYTISGAPGAGQRVIATAAVGDAGVPGAFVRVNAPASIAGDYVAGASSMVDASNNPTAASAGQTGDVVLALSGSSTLACAALTNASAVSGKIALVDRGTCGFGVKYEMARAAGAIAVIVGNNAAGSPIAMGGTVNGPVDIPAAMITLDAANALKARLAASDTVNATFPATSQGDILASFSSRGPRTGLNGVKPDLSAPGISITAAQTGVTCTGTAPSTGCQTANASGYLAGSQNLVLSGTSMAAPHAAGMMALLKQRFPDRSVEEMKAMAMNTSLHDVYQFAGNINRIGVDRSGAGRIDPVKALQSTVAAFNADEPGAVNLAFFGEVVGTQTQVKRIRVVNYGTTAQSFSLAFDVANDAPGIAFSLPGGSSITVPAGGTAFVDVQVDGTAAQMDHVRDVSADAAQSVTAPSALAALGGMPRHYLTNKSGYLNLSQAGNVVLRVPVYAALRPASDMATASVVNTGGNPTGSTTLALTGADVCTGTLGAGPSCSGTFPVTDVSRVSPFELQVSRPRNTSIPAALNVRYVGTAYDPVNNLVLFGIATWGDWGSPTDVSFNIHVDNDSNGSFDRILFHSNTGTLSNLFGTTTSGQDVFVNGVFIPPGSVSSAGPATYVNRLSAGQANSALFGNNVIILAATPAQLGLATGVTSFRYKVQTCFGTNPICGRSSGANVDEAPGPYAWNYAAQGLNFGGTHMAQDLNGASLPVAWNTANMVTNASLGALILHHHNASGKRAQVVTLQGAATADLGVAIAANPAAPTQGQNVTLTYTVNNYGPAAATGVVMTAPLPAGLTYVSDNGGGAFAPGAGVWTIGNLASGATQTLTVIAKVTGSGIISVAAQVAGNEPDPVASNNSASQAFTVAAQTSLSITNVLQTAANVNPGASSVFRITLRNTGVDTLLNISVNASRNPAATILSGAASSGSFAAGTGIWTLPSLAAGATAQLDVTVTVPAMIGTLTLSANATAENAPAAHADASTTVSSPANITATKVVSGASFAPGTNVTYTVVLRNTLATAQFDNPGDEFTDVLPLPLTLVSASASSGTAVANVSSRTVTWNGSIPGNGSVTITIVASIGSSAPGAVISNQGTARFDADGNGTNESSVLTDDPAVSGSADPTSFTVQEALVGVTKTVSVPRSPVPIGAAVVYTITMTNTGNAPTLNSSTLGLLDVVPGVLTVTGVTASAGTAAASGNTVTWHGSVPAGGSVTVTIQATVTAAASGSRISNQAEFSYQTVAGAGSTSVLSDDPALPGVADATTFLAEFMTVPTLSTWLLWILTLVLLASAGARLRARNRS